MVPRERISLVFPRVLIFPKRSRRKHQDSWKNKPTVSLGLYIKCTLYSTYFLPGITVSPN